VSHQHGENQREGEYHRSGAQEDEYWSFAIGEGVQAAPLSYNGSADAQDDAYNRSDND